MSSPEPAAESPPSDAAADRAAADQAAAEKQPDSKRGRLFGFGKGFSAPPPQARVRQPRQPRPRIALTQRTPLGIGFSFTAGALIAAGLAYTIVVARPVLIVILLAMFFALGLNPLVEWLRRRGLPRTLAVVIVLLLAFGILALAVWAIAPVVVNQITLLVTNGPALLENTRNHPWIDDLDERFQLIDKLTELLSSPDLGTRLFGGVLGASQLVINTVVSGITVTVLSIYFLASLPMIKQAIYRLSPKSRRDRMRYLSDEIFDKVGSYLSGLFVIVTLAGTGTFIMLMLNGLGEFALALAVVVALLDFIPLVGPTIGMVIVTTVAFANSPTQGIIALVYYLLYTQSEAYLIYPRVMARSVNVPGVVTITAALLGGALMGIVGALIAVPIAAVVLLLWHEVLQPRLDSS